MSDDTAAAPAASKSYIENILIALCLIGSLALLGLAWQVGDASPQAQERQWQIVFLGLSLALAGQWIVGRSSQARKQQIAATCRVMGVAGYGIQRYYDLQFSQITPFLIGYGFLFVAAEFCAFVGGGRPASRRTIQILRFGVVAWNLGWAVFFAATSSALPDVASLYIAFSLLWTVATAVIAWSEFCKISAAEAEPARIPPHSDIAEFLSPAEQDALLRFPHA